MPSGNPRPSKAAYFWAANQGKICWWVTYSPTALILGYHLSQGDPFSKGWLFFLLWLVSTVLLSLPLTVLAIAFLTGPLIGSFERNRSSIHTGDLVRILVGPHRDRVLRVYALWPERDQIRVEISAQAKKDVEDVFSIHQVFLERNAYADGHGPSLQKERELAKLLKAAEQEDAEALYALGNMYYLGDGVPQDKAQAFHWLTKAAEQGQSQAQHTLGLMYFEGDSVSEDKTKALHWYMEAAKQGHVEAQFQLARTRMCHKGDEARAFDWCTQAAEQEHAGAQNLLGTMYLLGIGVPENVVLAYAWMKLASEQEPEGRWIQKMKPEQLKAARDMTVILAERIRSRRKS